MKKRTIVAFLFVMCILPYSTSDAHPGRTKSDGGHTCRTNCENWGLEYGEYHYHGGGGSSSVDTSPSYDPQQEHDKGYKTGYNKGIEMGYKQDDSLVEYTYETTEYKDGWSEGFEKGWQDGNAKKESEILQVKQAKQGSQDGLLHGEAAFDKGKKANEYSKTSFPSAFYKKAYLVAFAKGWAIGQSKKRYNDAGYKLGSTTDQIKLPTDTKDQALIAAYKNGFAIGVKDRETRISKEHETKGYTDGKQDVSNPPKEIKEVYIAAYDKGYTAGQEELKKSYQKQGYDAAFTLLTYEAPKLAKDKYVTWYSEGFQNNAEVEVIKTAAYQLGKDGVKGVPQEYAHASDIFNQHYELGVKQTKKDRAAGAVGVSAIALGWLFRRFYIARKMIK